MRLIANVYTVIRFQFFEFNPLTPTCYIGTAKHLVPDRVKPLFVIFDIWALWRSALSVRVRMSKITIFSDYQWQQWASKG